MRSLLSITFILFGLLLTGQLTIVLSSIPNDTPDGDAIHIAGNFQSWDPGSIDWQLSLNDDGLYEITFTPAMNSLVFKFTRGGWGTVEGNAQGGFLPDRIYEYTGPETIFLEVLSWEDLGGAGGDNSTAGDGVSIIDTDFYIPQLDRNRRIWVYLPPDYATSGIDYPVMYMHDGQNLFDVETSFSGEWEVDETLDELHSLGDPGIIIVGIDNGGVHRIDELSPWVNAQYGGGEGAEYIDFIVETLKPFIDAEYRTLPGRESTAMMGSSLGGLISQYAVLEHQETFSKAGLFSPSYWFAPESFDLVDEEAYDGSPTRIYQIMAIPEGQVHVDNVLSMEQAFLNAGYPADDIQSVIHTTGAHSEWYWAREFGDAYLWLFDTTTELASEHPSETLRITPNPVGKRLRIRGVKSWEESCDSLDIVDIQGQLLYTTQEEFDQHDVSRLSPGTYLLRLHWKDGTSSILKMLKR